MADDAKVSLKQTKRHLKDQVFPDSVVKFIKLAHETGGGLLEAYRPAYLLWRYSHHAP